MTKKCPYCAEEIQAAAIKCKHCGEMLAKQATSAPQSASPTAAPGAKQVAPIRVLGTSGLVIGSLIVMYFLFVFDTTVEVPKQTLYGTTIGGGRVHNIGLLSERNNFVVLGGVLCLVGIGLQVFGSVLEGLLGISGTSESATPSARESDSTRLPYDSEKVLGRRREDQRAIGLLGMLLGLGFLPFAPIVGLTLALGGYFLRRAGTTGPTQADPPSHDSKK